MLRGSTTIITISVEYLPRLHYLNYPNLLPCWPRSSVSRASEDLIRRSWVQTPPRPNFLWPVGSPKFPLIRVETQGIWCIGSIAYFQHLTVDLFTIIPIFLTDTNYYSSPTYTNILETKSLQSSNFYYRTPSKDRCPRLCYFNLYYLLS